MQFPGLDGVLPSFGRMTPNDWGLAFELRDDKSPHWTGTRTSPQTFGQAALCVLTDREFGDWAKQAWPALGDAVLTSL